MVYFKLYFVLKSIKGSTANFFGCVAFTFPWVDSGAALARWGSQYLQSGRF